MGSCGYSDVVPASVSVLGSDATKVTPSVSASFQLTHTIVLTPASDQYITISRLDMDLNANTILGVNLQGGYSTQVAGFSESSVSNLSSAASEGGGSSDCTANTGYSVKQQTLAFTGPVGKAVTVRFYMKTNDVGNTSAMCARNPAIRGKLVKRYPNESPFRGSF